MYLVTFFIQNKIIDHFLFECFFRIAHHFEDRGSERMFVNAFFTIVFDKEKYGHDSLLGAQ